MDKIYSNPCTRCGKQRINSKSWEETVTSFIGTTSIVTYTETVCPDPKCQKEVEKELEIQKKKKQEQEQNRADRKKLNNNRRHKASNSRK